MGGRGLRSTERVWCCCETDVPCERFEATGRRWMLEVVWGDAVPTVFGLALPFTFTFTVVFTLVFTLVFIFTLAVFAMDLLTLMPLLLP
jgi:hypothetical protein